MIKVINPKKIVPIHTEHPDRLTNYFENVIRVEQGGALKL
jgi:mRNA degradation ribonuclease J1/J2